MSSLHRSQLYQLQPKRELNKIEWCTQPCHWTQNSLNHITGERAHNQSELSQFVTIIPYRMQHNTNFEILQSLNVPIIVEYPKCIILRIMPRSRSLRVLNKPSIIRNQYIFGGLFWRQSWDFRIKMRTELNLNE